jgi:hypothetical protein
VSRWFISLLLLTAACETNRDVTVVAVIPGLDPGGTAATGFAFIVLPYDRDSLVTAFESRAATPRPATAALDSLFAQYRAPFAAYTALVSLAAQYNDSLRSLRHQIDTIPSTSPAYGALYGRWQRIQDTLRAIDMQAARARTALEASRAKFVKRSDSLRATVRHWEDSTYRGYDSAVTVLIRTRHREPVADTTGPSGTATVRLRGGPWWVSARSWDPNDPNAEWYWNVPVTSDTVRLDASTGRNRNRY